MGKKDKNLPEVIQILQKEGLRAGRGSSIKLNGDKMLIWSAFEIIPE